MKAEHAQALEAIRNVKKALLEEISARFPFGKPEPLDSKKVEKFIEIVFRWLMLDDEEQGYFLGLDDENRPRLKVKAAKKKDGTDDADSAKGSLGIQELLEAWIKGRERPER